jgi:hypothetical protein
LFSASSCVSALLSFCRSGQRVKCVIN